MSLSAAQVIELLALQPATCGFVSETFRSDIQIPASAMPAAYAGTRPLGNVLYFLVTPDVSVQLHRIRSDRMYHHYLGDPLEVLLLYSDGRYEVTRVGSDLNSGMRPQLFIPGGTFHTAPWLKSEPMRYSARLCGPGPSRQTLRWEIRIGSWKRIRMPSGNQVVRLMNGGTPDESTRVTVGRRGILSGSLNRQPFHRNTQCRPPQREKTAEGGSRSRHQPYRKSQAVPSQDLPLDLRRRYSTTSGGGRLSCCDRATAAGGGCRSDGGRQSCRSGPLHYAADGNITGLAWDPHRQVKTIRCLLDAGADVNAQDKNGSTTLHRVSETRCAAAVHCLLQAGADPTLKNKSGSTPFHLAVQNTGRGGSGSDAARAAQRRIIKEFISFGVSTKLTDGSGKSVRIAPAAVGFETC